MGMGKRDNASFLQRLPLIAGASAASETATYPIDFVKTRMQFAQNRIGWFGTTLQVLRSEGHGIYSGIQPAILRHWVYSVCRIYLYEQLREGWRSSNENVEPGFVVKFAMGAVAGGTGQFIASPTDLLKIRMQTDRQKNNPPKYKGIRHCFSEVLSEAGVSGMWRGVGPNVYRAMAVNFGELATYDIAKRQVMDLSGWSDGIAVHSFSAIISGLAATTCSCPFDVMKTRLMAGSHTGILSCFRETVASEGFMAMYKGFMPTWARLGPWQFIFWVSYEKLRYLAGIEGF